MDVQGPHKGGPEGRGPFGRDSGRVTLVRDIRQIGKSEREETRGDIVLVRG